MPWPGCAESQMSDSRSVAKQSTAKCTQSLRLQHVLLMRHMEMGSDYYPEFIMQLQDTHLEAYMLQMQHFTRATKVCTEDWLPLARQYCSSQQHQWAAAFSLWHTKLKEVCKITSLQELIGSFTLDPGSAVSQHITDTFMMIRAVSKSAEVLHISRL